MKKMDIRNKIVEHKDDIRTIASGMVGSVAGYCAEVKLEELYQPERFIEKVGVKIAVGIVGGVTAKVANEGFKQIDNVGAKIKQKISEKKKGIHYAEYEVVNEATA